MNAHVDWQARAAKLRTQADILNERLPTQGGGEFSATLSEIRARRETAAFYDWLAKSAARREASNVRVS